ncbi:MAG: V4R domain-containing protein [Candidatus Heimdallarchaeota archaeon]
MMRWFRRRKEEDQIEAAKPSFPFKEGEVQSVKAPKEMKPLFIAAEDKVSKYFETMEWDPTNGRILIGGERYILIRAASMRISFPEALAELMELDEGLNNPHIIKIMYQLAKALGQADARKFHFSMGLDNPIEKLSAGPVHFAFTGWANVDIDANSAPSPDENFSLLYTHPRTFEADSFILLRGTKSPVPVCIMNAGYSAGWCSESFGVELEAKEISCRAKGDKECRFVMAHNSKLEQLVKENLQKFAK